MLRYCIIPADRAHIPAVSLSYDSDTTDGSATVTLTRAAIRDAAAPFDKPSADLILRSSDLVDFRVKKAILAEASSVLEDMFHLPSPPGPQRRSNPRSPSDGEAPGRGLPVVELTEDSQILEGLLRLCYPACHETPLQELDEAYGLLEAAKKYAMDGALDFLGQRLLTFAEASPAQVFALAVCFQLRHEVQLAAARAFLNHSIDNSTLRGFKELRYITVPEYLSLLDFRDRCAAAAVSCFDNDRWIDAEKWCWMDCATCAASTESTEFEDGQWGELVGWPGQKPRLWWTKMMSRCRSLVLAKPSGKVFTVAQACTAEALVTASKCTGRCHSRAPDELREFMALLAAEVDKAVAQVGVTDLEMGTD